jgi:hypothetical protein
MSSRGGVREGAGRKKGAPNKATADIKALARSYGPEAVEELHRIMKSSPSDQARAAAAREILDRGYGKSTQAVTVDPGDTFTEMLRELMGSVDGQTRGLPPGRTAAASPSNVKNLN